jgi:hypothetical protein
MQQISAAAALAAALSHCHQRPSSLWCRRKRQLSIAACQLLFLDHPAIKSL